ncbi:MAG: tetratricopeptide repeat protein [Kiritimatiellae bacterium]|nr:tetratricopeptide repeat protein [Kiritimatiellia bacterium]
MQLTGIRAAVLGLTIIVGGGLFAQEVVQRPPPEVEREVQYAKALYDMGLPDYAKMVLDRIKHPSAEPLIKVIHLDSLIAIGKFDEAKALIAREPDQEGQDAWAMKLRLADGYYAWGRYAEAQGIYNAFFGKFPQGPPEALNDFYINSAYKYAQMLQLMGKPKEAVEAYRTLLRAKVEKHVRRQVLSEMTEILVKLAETAPAQEQKGYLTEADKLIREILWKQDVWFGKAIVHLAHIKLIQGDMDGAMKMIEDYQTQLREIDESLRKEEEETGQPLTRLSPMAECRYLLGVMLQTEAEKLLATKGDRNKILTLLAGKEVETTTKDGKKVKTRTAGALQHFINVFVGYPGTSWAPDAGTRAKQVEEILKKEFGAKITTNVTDEQMAKVEMYQFQGARSLMFQQQFKNAIETYVKVLNLFPETPGAVVALGDLVQCHAEEQEWLFVEMVSGYLAERFSQNEKLKDKAGDQLLRLAAFFEERNIIDRREAMYRLFFDFFPAHPLAASTLFRFAERRFAEKDYEGALGYYQRIVASYTNAPVYLEALNKIAFCFSEGKKHLEEINTLNQYIKALEAKGKPSAAWVSAKYRLATAYKNLDPKYIPNAYNAYTDLIKRLTENPAAYAADEEEARKNQEFLEASLYSRALCLSKLKEPPEKEKDYKLQAVKSLEDLLERFPKSKAAPSALSQIGTLWTVLGDAQKAEAALRRLEKEYPTSPEAKNSKFVLAMNLLELGRRQEATRVFRDMLQDRGGQFTETQILTAGMRLAEAGEGDLALEAFDRVLATAKERAIREPALMEKTRVLVRLQRYAEAAETAKTLLTDYRNSINTIEANMLLSNAYGQLARREANADKRFDLFNLAIRAMKDARKYELTPENQARSDVGIARIQLLKARAEEEFGTREKAVSYRNDAIATYQLLIATAPFGDAAVRRHIEEAYHECIPLLLEAEKWADALEDCDRFLELFPNSKWEAEVRNWRGQARVKLIGSGAAVRTPSETASVPPTETSAPVTGRVAEVTGSVVTNGVSNKP